MDHEHFRKRDKAAMGLAGFAAALRARRTARLLGDLSDRQLKDIGLSRSDIGRVIRER
ncbi:DUF1127 domain-containing protein [Mesorhizobium onobrychidis]|uniref:DUF1127 domain-containing protein n=2 Tax=Mesorhizobium onobrychidis TaxID=2775404 RepID=A0ABY5R9M0_9HYPH|nr:DUF1127 domain-containing protein [Mesorhizobium onobrychidis]